MLGVLGGPGRGLAVSPNAATISMCEFLEDRSRKEFCRLQSINHDVFEPSLKRRRSQVLSSVCTVSERASQRRRRASGNEEKGIKMQSERPLESRHPDAEDHTHTQQKALFPGFDKSPNPFKATSTPSKQRDPTPSFHPSFLPHSVVAPPPPLVPIGSLNPASRYISLSTYTPSQPTP